MRAAYGYDVDRASSEASSVPVGKSLTVQSQTEEADINNIVRRFGLTGELPLNQRVPLAVDIDSLFDYRDCMDTVLAAQRSYESMPVDLRNRLGNSPERLVDFVLNPENRDECLRLGLIVAPPAPVEVPPVPSTPAAPIAAPGGAP